MENCWLKIIFSLRIFGHQQFEEGKGGSKAQLSEEEEFDEFDEAKMSAMRSEAAAGYAEKLKASMF